VFAAVSCEPQGAVAEVKGPYKIKSISLAGLAVIVMERFPGVPICM
jgi:hypothetical protein